ncbi:MAG TPA: hypothetical protein VER33_06265 [Polyangiaceae bacterium]|nr:hypothetical protein [Polyangiaceae bacterium]
MDENANGSESDVDDLPGRATARRFGLLNMPGLARLLVTSALLAVHRLWVP